MSNTLYITMPVSVLPDEEGWYIAFNEHTGDMLLPQDRSDTYFRNGKWDSLRAWEVTHWLKPISVERLKEVLLDFNDNRTCGMQLNRAIQEAINKLSK